MNEMHLEEKQGRWVLKAAVDCRGLVSGHHNRCKVCESQEGPQTRRNVFVLHIVYCLERFTGCTIIRWARITVEAPDAKFSQPRVCWLLRSGQIWVEVAPHKQSDEGLAAWEDQARHRNYPRDKHGARLCSPRRNYSSSLRGGVMAWSSPLSSSHSIPPNVMEATTSACMERGVP